jgi:hypothetical protein
MEGAGEEKNWQSLPAEIRLQYSYAKGWQNRSNCNLIRGSSTCTSSTKMGIRYTIEQVEIMVRWNIEIGDLPTHHLRFYYIQHQLK